MSRGYGHVQREVLEVFERNPDKILDPITIAAIMHDRATITESEASSTRRALRSLADDERVVDLGRHWRGGRKGYALPETAEAYRERYLRTFGEEAPGGRP